MLLCWIVEVDIGVKTADEESPLATQKVPAPDGQRGSVAA